MNEQLILDGHKLWWHQERLKAWMSGERIAPVTIDCALTRKCNYRCLYCYGKLQANDEKKMTKDVIFRFLDDARDIGVKGVSFISDGESSCSPYLEEAIIRGKAIGLDISLGTNGSLLTDEQLHRIIPALTYLRFNISAGTPHRYAAVMGAKEAYFNKVCRTVKTAAAIKSKEELPVTIGIQMVLMPDRGEDIIPFAKLGSRLGVDYAVIKHCSDDEKKSLKIDYSKYFGLTEVLQKAEGYSSGNYTVKAKWSKILSNGKRSYTACFGPVFMLQLSGSGLLAPCGMLFNRRFKRFHIGNIAETPLKKLFKSEKYWQVMKALASPGFDARRSCGSLCLQHKINEALWQLRFEGKKIPKPEGRKPLHVNFL